MTKFQGDESHPQDQYLEVITARSAANSYTADWLHTTVSQVSRFISNWQTFCYRESRNTGLGSIHSGNAKDGLGFTELSVNLFSTLCSGVARVTRASSAFV